MEKFADAATWGQLEYLKARLEKHDLKLATLRKEMNALMEWHEGDVKLRFIHKDGKKVLMRFTFEGSKEELKEGE